MTGRMNYASRGDPDPYSLLPAPLQELESRGKPVVITGDLNCAHKEIDLFSPKTNLKSAGFTIEERNSFQACLIDAGFVGKLLSARPRLPLYHSEINSLFLTLDETMGHMR